MNISSVFNLSKNKLRLLSVVCFVQMVVFCSSFAYSQVPDLHWAKGLGGFSVFGNSIAVNPTGNVYSTGYFKGNVDLDPGPGTFTLNSLGDDDGYISKLDVHGDFVWGRQIGGAGWNQATALALDAQNNIYVLGYIGGTANFGSLSLTATGPRDIFVCKLDELGNFLWAKLMPGNESNTPYAIATDSQNNVVITGGFKGTVDFDPGVGTFNLTSYGLLDIFVAKLNPSGDFMWAKQMGGIGSEWAAGVTVDGSDNILLTGNFKETSDFGGVSLSTDESIDVFVCKLASDGTHLWVKQFEGVITGTMWSGSMPPVQVNKGSLGIGKGIVTDNAGNVYTTGYYKGNVDFDPGVGTFYIPSVDSMHTNIFVSKLNSQGDFEWAKMIGNKQEGESWAIDVNALGNVYFTGRFYGTLDFDPSTSGTHDLTSGGFGIGGSDAFIGVLDDNGNFVWAGQFKGSDTHITLGWAIKADDLGRIYTTGYFGYGVDFDPGANVYILSTPSSNSATTYAFVHKIADSLNASFTASNTTICAGDSITFTDQSTGMGILAWNWTFDGGLPATAATIGPHTVTFNTAGTYTITLEIEDDLTDTDDTTIVITVKPNPTAIADVINTTICEGDDIELTATGVTGATYAWSGPGGYSNTSQNPTISNAGTSAGGTYTLTVTLNGCSAEDDVVITVNPKPTATAGAINIALCEGEDIELTASSVSGASYSWSGPGGYSNTSQNPIILNATSSNSGIYTLTVTLGSCSDDDDVTITVNPKPTFTVNSTNPSCGNSDGEIVITPAPGVNITAYSIDNGTSTQTGGTFSNLSAGNYTIHVTDNNGCEATQPVSLSNSTAPTISNIVTTQTSCTTNDGTITITASGTGTLQYSINSGANFQGSGIFTGLGVGNYNIVVKDANGCEAVGTATISQVNAPDLTLVSSNDVTCNGDDDGSIEVGATGGTGAYTYSWTPNVSTSVNATNLLAGDYTITVTDASGCTDDIQVTISEPDAIVIVETITNEDCGKNNGSVSLQVTGGDGNYIYAWDPNVGTAVTASNLNEGSYEVTVTDGIGCTQTGTYNVGMNAAFYLEIIPADISIKEGESVDIHLIIDPSVDVDTIIWSPAEGLSCTDCKNPTASPMTTTTYYVEVINTDGCSAKDSITITVIIPCAKIFVPTSFSPNGDGMNDLQCVMGGCIATMEFTIFDRWGEQVFYTLDQTECWDGMFRGKMVQSGVYVYRLKATLDNGERIIESGNINVVR